MDIAIRDRISVDISISIHMKWTHLLLGILKRAIWYIPDRFAFASGNRFHPVVGGSMNGYSQDGFFTTSFDVPLSSTNDVLGA